MLKMINLIKISLICRSEQQAIVFKEEIIEIDLVTEMKEIKHPFRKNQSKKGIDF